ncbi:MAG TPA: gamma-glutamylcyclotransferase family protein [Opitutaceae bacterium]|nr:gamma-glutamylcyclotransferase family protein [Opitutaceae bacterium]
MSAIDPNTELASHFTVERYRELKPSLATEDSAAWTEVIEAVRRRIDERYVAPVSELEQHDDKPRDERPTRAGFAIVALDCLLIDTIQSFREGRSETAEKSPARSFEEFLNTPRFSDFNNRDRGNFFQNVRNALLHNGETRSDWKIRIGIDRMLKREGTTRLLNRKFFHAAVLEEWKTFCDAVAANDLPARAALIRRLDAMAGIVAPAQHYFAYGSNMLAAECAKDAKGAQPRCRAFLPRHRMVFTKHSTSRNGDAASLVRDDTSVVWGYVYRVSSEDIESLKNREIGYELRPVVVFEEQSDFPRSSPIQAVTFIGVEQCPKKCGPPISYLELIIAGAQERELPDSYQTHLTAMLHNTRGPAVDSVQTETRTS